MKMKDFRVVFDYEGHEPMKMFKPKIERLFVNVYSLYCDQANALIEKFNDEYTGPDDAENPDGEYYKYMNDRLGKIARQVFGRMKQQSTLYGRVFKEFVVDDQCMLFGILNSGTIMSFHLEEI